MRQWTRPEAPLELQEQAVALTKEFFTKKSATGKTPSCQWPEVQNPNGETETMQDMFSRLTNKHCSYCDSRMGRASRDTIDHFLPKSKFGCQAYAWRNLYHCCDGCQAKKNTRHDRTALRPDEPGYSFSRYFRYTYEGKISVIAEADSDDWKRAHATIELLKLNDPEIVGDRHIEFSKHLKKRTRPLPKTENPDTALRILACRDKQSFEDLPFRDWYD